MNDVFFTFGNAAFVLVVFLANIVQGITGFAGAILAMPFCIFLSDMNTAKAVLGLLGITAGIQVCLSTPRSISLPVLRTILVCMIPAMAAGFVIVDFLREYEQTQRQVLGIIALSIGILGLLARRLGWRFRAGRAGLTALLVLAGIVHGMFLCGGPFLVVYLTQTLPDKKAFRATVSASWLILNSIAFAEQASFGRFGTHAAVLSAVCIPAAFLSVYLGGLLLKRMSQDVFMNLTNILLALSGLSLVLK